jgi:hypothetical protein
MSADQLKYTERDVRDNPEYVRKAYSYLEQYTGEFPYLIDMKMRLGQGMDLTYAMVKGVLNCMRNDPRVQNLPEPKQDFEADVIPMPERYGVRLKATPLLECENWNIHRPHSDEGYARCPGVRRTDEYSYRRPARVVNDDLAYVTAKSPSAYLVHRVTKVEVEWFPSPYEYGWNRDPQVIIHTNCRHPYYLRDGLLITQADVERNQEEWSLEYHSECIYDGTVFLPHNSPPIG